MSLENAIANYIQNLGIGVEDWVVLLFLMGILPLYAQDFRFGILIHFIVFGFLFVLANSVGINTGKILMLVFVFVVLMALGMLISFSKQGGSTI